MSATLFDRFDAVALADAWRAARPFPHLVFDDFLPEARLLELRQSVAREPHMLNTSDCYEMMASGLPMQHADLRAFEGEMASEGARAFLRAVTGKTPFRAEMRSFVYLAGSYLLPHSDDREGVGRLLAYSYYLIATEDCAGGELDLIECDMDGDDVVATRPGRMIDFRANRLVVFDVGPSTLHRVREVTNGARAALSGWYFA